MKRSILWTAVAVLTAVVLFFSFQQKADAATIDGLVWMDSPGEGCIAIVKDLGEGHMRVFYLEKTDDDLQVISVRKLNCTKVEKSKVDFCNYKIIDEYKKPETDG